MALSSSEKQQRWRERHIAKRRRVARIAAILLRQSWSDEHFAELGSLLTLTMNRAAIAALRRAMKPRTDEEMAAIRKANEAEFEALWRREHPGRSIREYRRQLGDLDSEVWQWRRAKGAASNATEREAWQADHPGEEFPEHLCGLDDREYTDYTRWQRKQSRRARSARL